MAKKSKVKIVFLIFLFVSAIFNIAISWEIITNTMSWIFDYIARPIFIILLILSIVSLITAIIYCFIKNKTFFVIVLSIFVCMIAYSSFVFSSFSPARPKPESMQIFIDLTDVEKLNILNISDVNKTLSTNEIRASILGKNSFEIEYRTRSSSLKDPEDYYLTQEIFGSDNLFFINNKRLINHLTNYYIKNDVYDIGIKDDDIYSFTKGDVNCTYVYKAKTNESLPDYELAYYAFVICNDENVYVASYDLMSTNPFTFDAEKATEKIVNELISNDCL